MKILYVTPHLSTGGLPQYLVEKIKHFSKTHTIYVIEYNNNSDTYIVQKSRVKNLIGANFYTLGDDKMVILDIIKSIVPDVIHFEEIPEYFISVGILSKVFHESRNYRIIYTTHGSETKPENIVHIPDKMVLVSEWSRNQFKKRLGVSIPMDVWEYPIYKLRNKTKDEARKVLGFDPTYKHVLNVGLFCSGKNQGEVFAVARLLLDKKIMFHFVGNSADNFSSYWKPLMESIPNNCVIWGERSDTDNFYQAADLFYFSSIRELNPIVVKESLSYELPIIMKKLEVYLDCYDENPLVEYICDDVDTISKLISSRLELQNMDDIYSDIPKNIDNHSDRKDFVSVSFSEGCSVSISGNSNREYTVIFKENESILYSTKIKSKGWSKINRTFYGNYSVDVYHEDSLILSEKLNLKNKSVKIVIESNSLGDTLAWIPYIDQFQRKHDCRVSVSCKFQQLFSSEYPNLNFVNIDSFNFYATYKLGFFCGDNWKYRTPINPKLVSLGKVATDILGLEYVETKPRLFIKDSARRISEKYVCIATQSTSQCKYWNNKTGWESVVNHLIGIGYKVVCIDLHRSFGNGEVNVIPNNVLDKTGNIPLDDRITDILHCDLFIGLGSGLSWLAWALNKPVVLISGFSNPISEFYNPHRVFNPDVCNSCWNDTNCSFDKNDWNWCPRGKGFECSSKISADMVIEKITTILK